MILLAATNGTVRSVSQFLTVLVIFIFVLFLTYWTTKVAGSYRKQQMSGKNIKIIETISISASKYIQIINIGDKYFAIGIGKDTISYLCELNGDSLNLADESVSSFTGEAFKDILDKFKKSGQVNDNEESDK